MAYNADTMSFELPDTDTVYVSGLPTNITEKDVEEYFGSIGRTSPLFPYMPAIPPAGAAEQNTRNIFTLFAHVPSPCSHRTAPNHACICSYAVVTMLVCSGVIKTDKKTRGKKIWLYRDKATGGLKGDGTVSYEDPFSAASAVEWFNAKEWKGVFSPSTAAVMQQLCQKLWSWVIQPQ